MYEKLHENPIFVHTTEDSWGKLLREMCACVKTAVVKKLNSIVYANCSKVCNLSFVCLKL